MLLRNCQRGFGLFCSKLPKSKLAELNDGEEVNASLSLVGVSTIEAYFSFIVMLFVKELVYLSGFPFYIPSALLDFVAWVGNSDERSAM